MIYFINGRPGGGKSLSLAEFIYKAMKRGTNVIANFEINEEYFAKCRHPEKLGRFILVENEEWTTNVYYQDNKRTPIDPRIKQFSYLDGLVGFAFNYHKRDKKGRFKEAQTLFIIDECADIWNSRTYNARDRLAWCKFFRQHRKLGYKVYLVAQDDKNIDKQIRDLLQTEIECRDVTSYKLFGKVIELILGHKLFVRIQRNYAVKAGGRRKEAKEYAQFFTGRKYYDFYDSYKLFSYEQFGDAQTQGSDCDAGAARSPNGA